MILGDVSVRKLAEFTCRQGDLYPPRKSRPIEPEQGIVTQKAVQQQRIQSNPDYLSEVPLAVEFQCGGKRRKLQGRADGLYHSDQAIVIEEFKTCGVLSNQLDLIDMAQALVYGGLYAHSLLLSDTPLGSQRVQVKVIYVVAETLEEQTFTHELTVQQAVAALHFLLLCYVTRIERHLERVRDRIAWSAAVQFPMPRYRPSQQAIARRVYQSLRRGENLLLEAPTGSGKSLAVIFPAVKVLEEEDQIFFLTSRNAGSKALLDTVRQIDGRTQALSVVEITAKEKVCPVEGMPCDATRCEYAAGYFDRVPEAIDAALTIKVLDRTSLITVSERYRVCPFELSLDVAPWADVVCGDYNYIFDPVVKLQRFSGHRKLHLLIDEAHQLSPRAREMLAVEIDRHSIKSAKKTTHEAMKKRVLAIERALLALRRAHGEGVHSDVRADSLIRACGRLLEVAAEEELELDAHPELRPLFLEAWRWQRSQDWFHKDYFTHLLSVQDRSIRLKQVCLDPGPYLQSVYREHGGIVRFSATVSPLSLYQRLHGQENEIELHMSERAGSPFRPEQALVLVVPDISTYYNARSRTLPDLVHLISQMQHTQPGRYLVALPSFAYLNALTALAEKAWGDMFVQTRGLGPGESDQLLSAFRQASHGVLFIVTGGLFSESVDFAEYSLKGLVIVGLGLPPPSPELDLIEAYYERAHGAGWGRLVAYTQPALVKNIQAAGRLIRAEDDFGVICLVDPRFTVPEVQHFFPAHWRPQVTRSGEVGAKVKQFWDQAQQRAV